MVLNFIPMDLINDAGQKRGNMIALIIGLLVLTALVLTMALI